MATDLQMKRKIKLHNTDGDLKLSASLNEERMKLETKLEEYLEDSLGYPDRLDEIQIMAAKQSIKYITRLYEDGAINDINDDDISLLMTAFYDGYCLSAGIAY